MSQWLEKAKRHAEQAVRADSSGDLEAALDQYVRVVEALRHEWLTEKSGLARGVLISRIDEYLRRAEHIRKTQNPEFVSGRVERAATGALAAQRAQQGGQSEENGKLRQALDGVLVAEKPDVAWSDVIGMEEAKQALREAVILPMQMPQLFTGARKPWRGVLLYGPPGTGKSHMAKALANEAKCAFFCVSSTDVVSKWQGESERLIAQLFDMAREQAPSIIFIDEVDSIARSRTDGEQESTRRIKTVLLTQMDGMRSDGQVLVLAATNTPWDIDAAFRRRCQKRIYVGLPDLEARMRILNLHLGTTPHALQVEDFGEIAMLTVRFSGSDLRDLVQDAVMQPIRCLGETAYVHVVVDDEGVWYEMCGAEDHGAEELDPAEHDLERVRGGPVTMAHFRDSLARAAPSVHPKDLDRFSRWEQEIQD